MAADRMAKELLGIAVGAESEAVKLAAIKDVLDRIGITAKHELEIGLKPYESVLAQLENVQAGSRAAFRNEPVRELPAVVEQDELEQYDELEDEPNVLMPDELERGSGDDSAPMLPVVGQFVGMLSLEAAVSAAATMRRGGR
jgi:hypothetical protein